MVNIILYIVYIKRYSGFAPFIVENKKALTYIWIVVETNNQI